MNRRSFKILAILLPVILAGCTKPEISGRVEDLFGRPVEGVTVSVVGVTGSVNTKADGAYQIPYVPGSFSVQFLKTGFLIDNADYNVSDRQKISAVPAVAVPDPGDGILVIEDQGSASMKSEALQSFGAIGPRGFNEPPTTFLSGDLIRIVSRGKLYAEKLQYQKVFKPVVAFKWIPGEDIPTMSLIKSMQSGAKIYEFKKPAKGVHYTFRQVGRADGYQVHYPFSLVPRILPASWPGLTQLFNRRDEASVIAAVKKPLLCNGKSIAIPAEVIPCIPEGSLPESVGDLKYEQATSGLLVDVDIGGGADCATKAAFRLDDKGLLAALESDTICEGEGWPNPSAFERLKSR